MRRTANPLLDMAAIQAWARQREIRHAGSERFEFVLRVVAPMICPKVGNYGAGRDRAIMNWPGWKRDDWHPRTLAAVHVFDRGGELYEPAQIGRPGPRIARPSAYMLNDCAIVLDDPVLERLLATLYRLPSRFMSPGRNGCRSRSRSGTAGGRCARSRQPVMLPRPIAGWPSITRRIGSVSQTGAGHSRRRTSPAASARNWRGPTGSPWVMSNVRAAGGARPSASGTTGSGTSWRSCAAIACSE